MHCKYNNWVRPTIYQGMYNAITRSLEKELIPACKRYGLDVVIYNPIAGKATGKLLPPLGPIPNKSRWPVLRKIQEQGYPSRRQIFRCGGKNGGDVPQAIFQGLYV